MGFDREKSIGQLVYHAFIGNGYIVGCDSFGGYGVQFELFPEKESLLHESVHYFEIGLPAKKDDRWLRSLTQPLRELWLVLVSWETYMEYAIDECMGEIVEFEYEVFKREILAMELLDYQQSHGEPPALWYSELARIDQRFLDNTVPSFYPLRPDADPQEFWYYHRFPKICQKNADKLKEGQCFAPNSLGCRYCLSANENSES